MIRGIFRLAASLVSPELWDQVIVLQVTNKSQVFALKSQVKTGKSQAPNSQQVIHQM